MLTDVNEYVVVLDACVLAPMPICDTLLRLAEAGFFIPKWSTDILREVAGVLQKFGKTSEQIAHREKQMNLAFEDALVVGYETLIDGMKNHPKDRHVLAAAVRAGADAIVTENLTDFPALSLAPFGIEAQNTDTFLMQQYNLAPDAFLEVLQEQAEERRLEYRQLIDLLAKLAPSLPGVISA
jgi:predicted nucleic acid-binding protein